ncbi:farnesol dehydrogenase [Diabrotica virgifera virgifera]|uniref:Farnesol dehydrogenase-like n=1 Tax=Diabrotica virgifera virgifera TaxID=50390 RepID=A0ABM5IQ45_DIAVI|nr:farnesol dehydrogenase [Diabrotica virgifera virgifera]
MVLSMDRWVGKVAVVTGASAGIGAAIVKQLAEAGLLVVGMARRKERVEEMAKSLGEVKGKIYAYKCDITNQTELQDAFKWITKNVGPVAVLVNNAGVHFRTSLVNGNIDAIRKTVDTNVLALCIATREAINIMKENNIDGHIFNINSVLGHSIFPFPNLDIYPATKYGVTAITETLRRELMELKSKIRVTSVSPGAVDTEIFDNMRDSQYFNEVLSKTILNPEDIADGVLYALSTPPHVQVHELTIKPVGEQF